LVDENNAYSFEIEDGLTKLPFYVWQ